MAVSYYIFLLITPLPSYHNLPTTYHCSNGSHCISWWLASLTQFVENSQPAQSFNMVTIIVLSWRKGLLSNLLLSNYTKLSWKRTTICSTSVYYMAVTPISATETFATARCSLSDKYLFLYLSHTLSFLKSNKKENSTDLGNLVEIVDSGYSTTVWQISNFPATLILRWINFAWFQQVKNCQFNNFGGFEFWFSKKCHTWKCQKFPMMPNSVLLKWTNCQF